MSKKLTVELEILNRQEAMERHPDCFEDEGDGYGYFLPWYLGIEGPDQVDYLPDHVVEIRLPSGRLIALEPLAESPITEWGLDS